MSSETTFSTLNFSPISSKPFSLAQCITRNSPILAAFVATFLSASLPVSSKPFSQAFSKSSSLVSWSIFSKSFSLALPFFRNLSCSLQYLSRWLLCRHNALLETLQSWQPLLQLSCQLLHWCLFKKLSCWL